MRESQITLPKHVDSNRDKKKEQKIRSVAATALAAETNKVNNHVMMKAHDTRK